MKKYLELIEVLSRVEYSICTFYWKESRNNLSFLMNIDITGVLVKLCLSIFIVNSQCNEGANDINIQWKTYINNIRQIATGSNYWHVLVLPF